MSFGDTVAKQNMKSASLHHLAQYVLLFESKFDDDEQLTNIASELRLLLEPFEILKEKKIISNDADVLDLEAFRDKKLFWKQQSDPEGGQF